MVADGTLLSVTGFADLHGKRVCSGTSARVFLYGGTEVMSQKSLARAATFSRAARMLASALSPHVFSTANARTSCTPMKCSQNST
jgi:hypothetical protein